MTTSLDADVVKILASLKEHNLDDNTLVIFTGDNGAHPTPAKMFNSDSPLRGAKRDMYEGGWTVFGLYGLGKPIPAAADR